MSRIVKIQSLIKENQRRLDKLKEQKARLGINAPPEILNEIEDIEADIELLKKELEVLAQRPSYTQASSDSFKKPKNSRHVLRKRNIIIGVVIAVIIIVGLFIPPYNVSDVNWCANSGQSVEVIGRLTTKLLKTSVSDGLVQIKVFEIGSPFQHSEDTKYATTSADGWFAVTFPPPIPSADKTYIINVAYSYNYLLLGERWKISNFGVGALLPCPTQ